jgi:hypothetical protein
MRNIVPIKMYEYVAMRKPAITTPLHGVLREFGDDNGELWIDQPEDSLMSLWLSSTRAASKHAAKQQAICSQQRLGHGCR